MYQLRNGKKGFARAEPPLNVWVTWLQGLVLLGGGRRTGGCKLPEMDLDGLMDGFLSILNRRKDWLT